MTKDEILAKLRTRNATNLSGNDLVEHVYDVVSDILADKPCVYESRSYAPRYAHLGEGTVVSYCRTHGWDCPNLGG